MIRRLLPACCLAVLLTTGAARAQTRPLHQFLTLAISPDGSHIALLEVGHAPDGRELPRALVIRDASTGEAATVAMPCGTAPDCTPGGPAWSPDGRRLAFALRLPGGHDRTIYTVDATGRDLTRIAAFPGTVITLRYSAHGDLAALAVADADKEAGASEPGATGPAANERPLEQRIGIIEGGGLHWASPPDLFVYEYDWRPDGSGFVGTAAPGDGDAHWWSAKLYAFDRDGTPRVIYAPRSASEQIADPKITSDGRNVAFVAGVMSDFDNPGGDAFLLGLDGAAAARPLTAEIPATVTALLPGCHGDLVMTLLAQEKTALVSLDPATGARQVLWQGPAAMHATEGGASIACPGGRAAGIRESVTAAPEVFAGPVGDMQPITRENAGQTAPVRALSVAWQVDGLAEQGWLMLPTVHPPGPLPLVTVPHGGPAWSYQPSFLGPGVTRALVEHGYAVFLPNPRGSYGQGEAFTRANIRDFGHGDYRDIMAGMDAALRAAPADVALDADRLGITGVSYGGFMTMWSVAHSTRFRAAVARAGISDWQSYYGQTGIVGWMPPYFGASAYDDPDIYARSSPIAAIKAVRTPTLLLVGEADIECPPPQSREFWHALREIGVPTDFHVYPGEGHELRDPKDEADAEQRMIAWFDRYLR